MKKKTYKAIGILAGAIALALSLYIGREAICRLEAETIYANVAKEVWATSQLPETSENPVSQVVVPEISNEQIPPGLISLMTENQAVKGWITIPGTAIDYPILQNEKDNEFYLHRDLNGKKLYSGSIFLDTTSTIDGPGIISVYGHHMKAGYKYGTMFRDISKFQNTEFLKSHQDVTIYTDNKIYQYTPVLCISRKADPSLRTQPESQEDLKTYFRENYNFDIQNSDKVLVLITCAYNTDNARTYLFCLPELS
mgnify:FL=1